MSGSMSVPVPDEPQIIYAPGVADMYADSFQMAASAYTISLQFGMQIADKAVKPQVMVRMSAQHAKVMAIIFKRLLKQYEEQVGEIVLPSQLLAEKEIDLARDW